MTEKAAHHAPSRVDALNEALELMHFGFRALVHGPDVMLASRGLGRAQHRVLYFLARRPGRSVQELVELLSVTRQALHESMAPLLSGGFVELTPAPDDRRRRLVTLTREGAALEEALSGAQRATMAAVFAEAGPEAEARWREVMRALARRLPPGSDATLRVDERQQAGGRKPRPRSPARR
ncbi:MarR family winged helix-turn-helix transcriptional regulator [Sorangium sp. So ce131]|uniref:MarR family winged helix-turn-helix transcriptional regulator n=1 Tax=Sorangium sp. So ce131 TaxID=3133282 RepID=UPI003F625BAF